MGQIEPGLDINFKVTKDKSEDSTLKPQFDCLSVLGYYEGTDIATGAINVITHDDSYLKHGQGVKTLVSLKKYQVDILGNVHPVKKEKRQAFSIKQKAK